MQIAVITGGSAGIGHATVRELGKSGIGVVFTHRKHEVEAKETVAEIESAGGSAVALPLDLTEIDALPGFTRVVVDTIKSKWGADKFNFLVNNAGIGSGATAFEDVTEEMFDRFHRVLFKGPYFLTQGLLPYIEDGGAIVNTGSNSALDSGITAGYTSYASQKGAMHVLTKNLAKELAPRGIRVNAVAPGVTRTRIADDAFARQPEIIPAIVERVALGRLGEPTDIAKVIAFLLSDQSGWITGQIVEASGGEGL